jgi:hypothetical protein
MYPQTASSDDLQMFFKKLSFLPFYKQNPHKKNFGNAPEISPAGYIDLQNRRKPFGKRGANGDRKNNLISRPEQCGGGRTTRKTEYRL